MNKKAAKTVQNAPIKTLSSSVKSFMYRTTVTSTPIVKFNALMTSRNEPAGVKNGMPAGIIK